MTLRFGDIVQGKSGKYYEVAGVKGTSLTCFYCCFRRCKPSCSNSLKSEFNILSCYVVLPIGSHFKKLEGGI